MPYTGYLLLKNCVGVLRRAIANTPTEDDMQIPAVAMMGSEFTVANAGLRAEIVSKAARIIMGSDNDSSGELSVFNEYDVFSFLCKTAPAGSKTYITENFRKAPRRFENYLWVIREFATEVVAHYDSVMAGLVSSGTITNEDVDHIVNLTSKFGPIPDRIKPNGLYATLLSSLARPSIPFTDVFNMAFGGWPESVGYLTHVVVRLASIINTSRSLVLSPRAFDGNSLVRDPVAAFSCETRALCIMSKADERVRKILVRNGQNGFLKTYGIPSSGMRQHPTVTFDGQEYMVDTNLLARSYESMFSTESSRINRYSERIGGSTRAGATSANGRPRLNIRVDPDRQSCNRIAPQVEESIRREGGSISTTTEVETIHVCASCNSRYVGTRLSFMWNGEDTTLCHRCWDDVRVGAICERHDFSNLVGMDISSPDEMGCVCPRCQDENRATRHLAYHRDGPISVTNIVGNKYEIEGEGTSRFLKRLVGVEFETGLITDMAFKIKASKFFKTPGWQIHRDPSLESGSGRGLGVDGRDFSSNWLGWEFVTPPVGGDKIEPCVREFYALRDDVITPKHMNIESVLAGMHVHADFRDFFAQLEQLCVGPSKDQEKAGKLWKNFVRWGKESARIVRQFVSKRRREYCYCNGDLGYRGKHGLKSNLIDFALRAAAIDNVNYPQYSALTLSGKTMEFRIWPSTDNVEFCLARVELTQKLTEFFMNNQGTAGEILATKAKTQTFIQRGFLVKRIGEILELSPECIEALSAIHRRYFFKTFQKFDAWVEAKEQRSAISASVDERELGAVYTSTVNNPGSNTSYVFRDRGGDHASLEVQNPELLTRALQEQGVRENGCEDQSQITLLDTMVAIPSGVTTRGDRTERAMRYIKDDGSLERVAVGYRVQA